MSRSNTDIRVRLPTTSSPLTPSQPTIYEDEIELEVLKVLPFDSNRKRMSIVVKMDEELILLCKGADEQVSQMFDVREIKECFMQMNFLHLDNSQFGPLPK